MRHSDLFLWLRLNLKNSSKIVVGFIGGIFIFKHDDVIFSFVVADKGFYLFGNVSFYYCINVLFSLCENDSIKTADWHVGPIKTVLNASEKRVLHSFTSQQFKGNILNSPFSALGNIHCSRHSLFAYVHTLGRCTAGLGHCNVGPWISGSVDRPVTLFLLFAQIHS